MKIMKKALGLSLAVILCLSSLSVSVFAAGETESDASEIVLSETLTVQEFNPSVSTDDASVDENEELLIEYLSSSSGTVSHPAMNSYFARNHLSGVELTIYDRIREHAEYVAKGSELWSIVELSISDMGLEGYFSAEDLGVSAITSGGSFTQEAIDALWAKIDAINFQKVITALLFDCPALFYWYDKVEGMKTYFSVALGTINEGGVEKAYFLESNTVFKLIFFVAVEYSLENEVGTSMVDKKKTSAISTVKENIQTIISEHQSESDYQKLLSYRNEICDAVSYNTDAANGNFQYQYGNPWQLVWVFDGDDSTNVVCEGYSKAFQFLCDESEFQSSSVQSRMVTGTMAVGTEAEAHMWNVVTMDDEKNYLVDVTNCDTGSIGAETQLFVVPYSSGSVEAGYSFLCDSSTVSYAYDSDTTSSYDESELTINSSAYVVIKSADYSAVDAALAKVPADLTIYTDETAAALQKAVDAVVRGKTSEEQSEVDAMAAAIETAISNLEIKHVHELSAVPAKDATCEETGNSAYWECKGCGKFFSDAEGTTEIEKDSWVIPALGHKFGEPTYTWSADNKTVTASRVCTNDKAHVETETADTTYKVTKAATSKESGIGTFTAAFKNEAFTTQTKEVEIPPTGIQWKTKGVDEKFSGVAEDVNGVKYYLINGVIDEACTESLQNGTIDKLQDVHEGDWFFAPVIYAVSHKNDSGTPLMKGYAGETLFGPADPLTRGMFATILYRYENEPATVFDPNKFPDVTNVEDFFATPAIWASQMGYIKGYENGEFGAVDNITREQLAVILFRYAEAKGYDVSAKGDLSKFTDTEAISSWAKDQITWANGAGIISGKENKEAGTRFIDPQGNASRAECAAMLQRFIAYAEGQQK